jgi:hypothetical protein
MKKNPNPIRRARPPLTDEELASAEQTMQVRDRTRQEAIADEQEQTRLAMAGDPDALEALKAGASALLGRPVDPDPEPPPPREKRNVPKKPKRPEVNENIPVDDMFKQDAYRLMDASFRKWKLKSEKDPRGAFRDLARDLGGDTAIYLKANIWRLSDVPELLMKLTSLGKPKEEEAEGGEDFESELESLRGALRGGK